MSNINNRWFQWIASERKGEVVVFDKIVSEDGNVYIAFKDGTRVNEDFVAPLNQKDLTGKFVAEVDSPNNVWSFKEEWIGREEERWEKNADGEDVCVQPLIPGRKIINLTAPRPTPKTHSSFGAISNFPSNTQDTVVDEINKISSPKLVDQTDPVYILMSKSKKIDNDILMEMTVSLPPKSLYELAKDSFEKGDTKFIDYIVDEITVDDIKEALKTAIRKMYENLDTTNI